MMTNPEKKIWEVIVVGTGIGGATAGYALAKNGRSVLFCEEGKSSIGSSGVMRGNYAEMFFPTPEAPQEKHGEILEKAGRWRTSILDCSDLSRRKKHIPFLGSGTGGSSALYGAAMERFFPEDFLSGEFYEKVANSTVPRRWPIVYEELEPYYKEAERLYGVRGGMDPLRSNVDDQTLQKPPHLSAANQVLYEFLENKGLHPYRLPVACELVPGCQSCQGFLCDRNCKNDSVKACLEPAIIKFGADLMDECSVIRLKATGNKVTEIECQWRGKEIALKAKIVVLAAGALATPAILLKSVSRYWPEGLANRSGLVGRNLMRHYVDLYALFPKTMPSPEENTKEIAFNDFYIIDGNKLGTVQSFGWLPPAAMLAESVEQDIKDGPLPFMSDFYKFIKPVARRIFDHSLCRSLVMATTMEDLPFYENRVFVGKEGRISIRYKIDDSSKQRIEQFRGLMRSTLKPWRYFLIKQAENNQRIAHACGTCRMGENPRESVVDPMNRAHGLENLFIVDSSYFPSSGGTNPSLTIAANALRVADNMP